MRKKEVYIVVDTPKKARKAYKVLSMFGESIYKETHRRLTVGEVSNEFPNIHFLFTGQWTGDCRKEGIPNKTPVSIKQLKQILAKEHLKVGDWIVESYKNEVCKITDKADLGIVLKNKWFKRYATPEEIALLEPKPKELEAGKWYKYGPLNSLMVWNKGNDTYGFFEGSYDTDWSFGFDSVNSAVEATPQEVESALIEEAKRRGYKVGNSKCLNDGKRWDFDSGQGFEYFASKNLLMLDASVVFKNGKWAYIVEVDKFAELKEDYKNGAMIQVKLSDGWCDVSCPNWDIKSEYRIKPEVTTIFMYRTTKGNKCIKEFPIKQKHSLLQNGWKLIHDTIIIEKLRGI